MRLGARAAGQAPLELFHPDAKVSDAGAVRRSADGSLMLLFGGARIEFRVNQGRPAQPPGTRQHLLALFHGLDAGGKGYLTRDEAQRNGFFPDQFALLDQNSDGKLTEQELAAYLDDVQDAASAAIRRDARAVGVEPWAGSVRRGWTATATAG